mgnify:CR=1 FL=1
MGVMNLTPDSFSDGGRIGTVEQAVRQATHMLDHGADVLDLGGQSTRPGAGVVGPERELERLLPALLAIRAAHPTATLSVDTFSAAVAEQALAAGATWINDVRGANHTPEARNGSLRDPAMLALIAQAGCPYVLMHSRGDSGTMDSRADYVDVVHDVRAELEAAAECALAAGVRDHQLIWDPGLGFAKTTHQNLELVRRLAEWSSAAPLLIGPSRKRFIGAVLEQPRPRARIWGTAAVCSAAVQAGAAVIRVHDVRAMGQVMRMATAIRGDQAAW